MTEHSADTVELKPCPNPWCDGDRLMVIWDLHSRRVICTCGVKGPRSATKANTTMGVPINDGARYVAEKEAREAWNTRTALTVEDAAKVQGWQPIETAPKDGTSVLLFMPSRICEGWFAKGEWSDDTPISPAEYSGEVWVCCDDEFQVEVELGPEGFECHSPITHWRPLPEPPDAIADTPKDDREYQELHAEWTSTMTDAPKEGE